MSTKYSVNGKKRPLSLKKRKSIAKTKRGAVHVVNPSAKPSGPKRPRSVKRGAILNKPTG